MNDSHLMARAFAVGERGRGRVSPNPFVGCVIVSQGEVVGEGFTQPAGGAHAEVQALAMAGDQARGATAYVTLEPCNHTGRTPPCTQALIGAGVARVMAALPDPHALASGGAERLRRAGITVDVEVATEQARRTHEIFLHTEATGRPFVVAKVASSIDGFTADHMGASQWITGPAARERGHQIRAEVDAVLVGSGAALADDPSLTVRLPNYDGPQPLRVVLDRRGRLTGVALQMFADGNAPVVVLDAPDPATVLTTLWGRGVRSVLIEGGAGVIGAFLQAGLIDRFHFHLAGVVLGQGLSGMAGAFTLDQAPRLDVVAAEVVDGDVLVTAYPTTLATHNPSYPQP